MANRAEAMPDFSSGEKRVYYQPEHEAADGCVSGCNKVVGKALMLDMIVNYVQSLHQAGADEDLPPAADQVWEGFAVPEGFHELLSHLLQLGSCQFCDAKVFEWTPWQHRHWEEDKCFAMFTRLAGVSGLSRDVKRGE